MYKITKQLFIEKKSQKKYINGFLNLGSGKKFLQKIRSECYE